MLEVNPNIDLALVVVFQTTGWLAGWLANWSLTIACMHQAVESFSAQSKETKLKSYFEQPKAQFLLCVRFSDAILERLCSRSRFG